MCLGNLKVNLYVEGKQASKSMNPFTTNNYLSVYEEMICQT